MNSIYIWCYILIVCLEGITLKSASLSSPSDVLFLRHGRSRVRHSTEKNHIRWGLKAFDNLTLDDYDYEIQNGTTTSNDLQIDMVSVNVGQNQSIVEANILRTFDSNSISATRSILMSTPSNRVSSLSWTQPATTSPLVHKKLAKKEIMENIRRDVDAGVNYLKSHLHLSAPTVSLPDWQTLILRHKINSNKMDPTVSYTTILNDEKNVKSSIKEQHPNEYDEKIQADDSHSIDGPFPTDLDNKPVNVVNQPENTIKYNLNDNDLKTSHIETENVSLISPIESNVSGTGTETETGTVMVQGNKINENLSQSTRMENLTKQVKKSNTLHTDAIEKQRYNTVMQKYTEQGLLYDDSHINGSKDTNDLDIDLPFFPSGLYSSDVDSDIDNTDDQTNLINLDLVDELNSIPHQSGQMDYVNLDDLDDISRNNRLKMKKGSDILTRFLEIVESQHLLGANCTAGTALNLGEGVVDQYAQERFQTKAEVAVNRANMLTR